jgi:hypothetical protein
MVYYENFQELHVSHVLPWLNRYTKYITHVEISKAPDISQTICHQLTMHASLSSCAHNQSHTPCDHVGRDICSTPLQIRYIDRSRIRRSSPCHCTIYMETCLVTLLASNECVLLILVKSKVNKVILKSPKMEIRTLISRKDLAAKYRRKSA